MKVTVLYGGPSDEREISLISGKAVIEGLQQAGHDVFASDISPGDLRGLDHPGDVVFPVLHGQFGESGELQEILEQPRHSLRRQRIRAHRAWASIRSPPSASGRRRAAHAGM